MKKLFYVGIKAVIIQDKKVLIIKGGEVADFWLLPGGRIDDDETVEEALERELLEELPNIKNPEMSEVLDAYRITKDVKDDISLTLIFYRVLAEFEGKVEISTEHSDYLWATQTEALGMVEDSCKGAIKRAFENLNTG
jgi:ADP-ribose pyrophosphatase YjhB (NUDIX family)